MGVTQRLDQFQQRHSPVGFPLAVAYKFVDDQGVYLAALMTYYGFLSLFPLLLLLARPSASPCATTNTCASRFSTRRSASSR